MSDRYLDRQSVQALIEYRNRIFAEHKAAYDQFQIDILANDTLSALSIWEIVNQYDPDYNTNFHRNGEDAKSNGILIEQKCATISPAKKKGTIGKAGFQFHAQGKLEYDRYIFAVRRKDDLTIVRIWDVSSAQGIALVQGCLEQQRQRWIGRGKPNHDAIMVHEKDLIGLPVARTQILNGCLIRTV